MQISGNPINLRIKKFILDEEEAVPKVYFFNKNLLPMPLLLMLLLLAFPVLF